MVSRTTRRKNVTGGGIKVNKNNLIQLDNINKDYLMGKTPVPVLKNISLSIDKGEYIAIWGPSGSGKTTLMNILGCLDTPSSGDYWLNNKQVSHFSTKQLAIVRNQEIGFVFQGFHLLPHLSALDNVALPLVYRGEDYTSRQQRAKELLTRVGLADRLNHKPSELSGGQKQRVAIARALVTSPNVILADEPTGNLDTRSGQEVIALFEELSAEGKTIILVTHDPAMAQRAKRIVSIRDGEIE
jgi:putative ABC transport system ATP-binding protein